MMRNRSRFESLLHDYCEGVLDDATRSKVESRLARDARARVLLEDVRATRAALALLHERPEPPVPADDALAHIQQAIRARAFEKKPRLHLEAGSARFYRRLAAAATVLFAVATGLLFARGGTLADQPPAAPAPPILLQDMRPAGSLDHLRPIGEMSAAEFIEYLDRTGLDETRLPRIDYGAISIVEEPVDER